MQRLVTWIGVIALVFAMLVNVALFTQIMELRSENDSLRARMQSAQPEQASQEQAAQLAELQQKLDRAEKDRIKATRDATSLRNELTQLRPAAQERDTLKGQLQTLQQENEQLRSQVSNFQTMNEINGQMVKVRELTPIRNVPRQFMNHAQLRTYITDMLNKEGDSEQRQRTILRALDMDSGGENLRQQQIDDMVKSILGFYDHASKQLVVVSERAQMGLGDRLTYAHEFVHNLQDQHFDLNALTARAAGNSDYDMAIRALIEGDATMSMYLYAEKNFSELDMVNYKIELIRSLDLSDIVSSGGGPLIESAASFPYNEGLTFAATLYATGNWAELDRAFKNPPRSTEQILHPYSYYNGDEPVTVRLPKTAAALGGSWQTVAEDTLGELYLRIYLEHYLSIDYAQRVGIGWGGDRYQVLSDDQGRTALVLQTAWDAPSEAQEFFEAYSKFVFELSGGTISKLRSEPTRMRWQLAGRQIYLCQVGKQVLVLHAPDGAALDALIGQFPGF